MGNISQHRAVQAMAKSTLAELGPTIIPEDTERSIAERATKILTSHGIRDTWYYDCPALVLLGSRSCVSVSGRDYTPGEEPVGVTNMVTVDLSPMQDGVWGDCARSFFVENGVSVDTPSSPIFARGVEVEAELHNAMRNFVSPKTSFGELFEFANSEIERHGFENVDFLGNLGHSIESRREARRYIERDNRELLGDVDLFTFEPHVRERGASWGFKHENIYYFNESDRAVEL